MKKCIATGLLVLMGGVGFAETYYLQADMTTDKESNSPLIKEMWFSKPSGGGEHPEKMTGNTFVVNGKAWRTPNSTGTSKFPGTILVDHIGAGVGELMGVAWQPSVLKFESPSVIRLRRPAVTLQPGVLSITGKGAAEFRAHSDGSITLMIEPEKLEGDGRLVFGKYKATDTKGVWSLKVVDSAGFSGEVVLDYGMLTIEDPLNLPTATFSFSAKNEAVLVVDEVTLTVKSMTVDGKAVSAGIYTAKELSEILGERCIKGSGKITILQ